MITFRCSCERKEHSAPIDSYEISSGAIYKIPEILKDYKKIYLVADENTYRVAGKKVEEILRECGKLYAKCILKGECVLPNAETLGNILMYAHDISAKSDIFAYSPMPDYILAVGSGTVNDSCRLASYRLGLPYGIVGTAPSMDGYASAGSPFCTTAQKPPFRAPPPSISLPTWIS